MRGVCMLALAASLVSATPALAQQQKPAPLPADIVAAWEKAGARAGWVRDDLYGHPDLQTDIDDKEGYIPAIQFRRGRPGMIARLPQLPQPPRAFGLSLANTEFSDAGLKELAGMKHLQALNLDGTKVTGARLHELAASTSLRALNLFHVKITPAGLRGLAKVESLEVLHLGHSPLMDAELTEPTRASPSYARRCRRPSSFASLRSGLRSFIS